MNYFLQKLNVEITMPNMTVLEDKAFRRYLGLDDVIRMRPLWWD